MKAWSASHLDFELNLLPTLVRAHLKDLWHDLLAPAAPIPTPKQRKIKSIDLPLAIYQKLTAAKHCRQRPADPETFLSVIREAVAHDEAIPVVIGHGPLKNRNNCADPRPDWAEFFTYAQLTRLDNDIRALYRPGLAVTFYVDDARTHFSNRVPYSVMDNYIQGMEILLRNAPFERFITGVVRLNSLYRHFQLERYYFRGVEPGVMEWMRAPENREAWQTYVDHASKNLMFDDEVSEAEAYLQCREAAIRYKMAYRAEKLAGIWSRPETLYMRYSGHHGFHQLFTLRKGSVSQPWQGEGCLLLTAEGRLDPFIMTINKADRYEYIARIENPLPVKGLGPIAVVREKAFKAAFDAAGFASDEGVSPFRVEAESFV